MSLLFLLALALAPVIAIILFVWFKDKYDREPIRFLVLGFILGIISIIPAIILEMIGNSFFPTMDMMNVFLYSFFVVALAEEGIKFFFLRIVFYKNRYFNEPFDGIIYAVMISMGFAAAENIMYVMNHGFAVGLLRMFTAVPAHAGFAILMGYFVGKAKFAKQYKTYILLLGLFNAILFHGLYDFFLLQNDSDGLRILAFVTLIICLILSKRALNKRRKHLFAKNTKEEDAEEEVEK